MKNYEARNLRVSIRLLADERAGVERLAREMGRSYTALLRIALHEYLIAHGIGLESDPHLYKAGWLRKQKKA